MCHWLKNVISKDFCCSLFSHSSDPIFWLPLHVQWSSNLQFWLPYKGKYFRMTCMIFEVWLLLLWTKVIMDIVFRVYYSHCAKHAVLQNFDVLLTSYEVKLYTTETCIPTIFKFSCIEIQMSSFQMIQNPTIKLQEPDDYLPYVRQYSCISKAHLVNLPERFSNLLDHFMAKWFVITTIW